jgi:hypothetical protein
MMPPAWTCHVCGTWRLDADIAIAYRPLKYRVEQYPDLVFHVRYCRDNPDCGAFAHAKGPWVGPPRRDPPRET